MSPSTRSVVEAESSVPNLKTRLEISKLVKKPLKEQTDQRDDGAAEASAVLKVVSKSWRDKKRLYPPFRPRKKYEFPQKIERGKEMIENLVLDSNKFRLSVCIRKNQFPIVCANIPIVSSDENPLEFGRSDFLYSSSGSGRDNEIPSICGLHDAPCIEPICGQDNKFYNITRESNRVDDVCQDAVPTRDDKSDNLSVPSDKRESHYYMTVCGESIDYVICGSREEGPSLTAFEDELSHEDMGEEEYFDIHEGEYESFGFASENESKSKFSSESELFQDPLVSHRLAIPYKEIPPSRYCVGGSFDDSSKITFLPKRPQSPVRNIPEERFDVDAGIEEVTRRAEIHNAKYALRKSKEWMDKMITSDSTSSPTSGTSVELLTTFFKVLLDDVRLSLTVGESENDLSLTLATIWAITEFVMTETGFEMTQSVGIAKMGTVPKLKRSLSHNLTLLNANSFPKTLDISYLPRGSDNHFLHRALPWEHLCAAHAEGMPKNYATVRTCIDEVTPDNELGKPRAAYLSDISCAHLDEMLPNKLVSLKNKADELGPKNHID